MYQKVFHGQTHLIAACAIGVLALGASGARADTAKCIATISKATAKYEIAVQKASGKCEDAKAKDPVKTPSCPDAKATSKITGAQSKLSAAITKDCGGETVSSLGFSGLVNRCNGGARDTLYCAKNSDCEGQCGGGAEPGAPCTSDSNCPATCFGGSADGQSCKGGGATVCTLGGGVCNNPANLGHCNSPAGGTCDPADRCAPVVDDSAPFASCDAPLASLTDITTCLECNANAVASAATGFAYGARRPPFGDPAYGVPDEASDSGKAVLGCQRALGKATSKYFQKVRKATQKCTAGVLKAGSGTCPDSKLTDAITKSKAKLDDFITKKCGGTLFAETLNGDQVLALDPLAANLGLPNTGPAFGNTAQSLMNTLATCSDGFAVPSVLGGCLSNCGNGQIDPGEDCDDGNVVNGDNCPADCHLNTACAVTGTATVTFNVSAPADTLPLGALKAYLAYDNTKVNLPGSGAAATVAVTASAFSVSANDLDSAIIIVVADPSDIGSPPFTVQFNICSGASVTAADFSCLVDQAGAAAGAQNAYGVSCSVTVM